MGYMHINNLYKDQEVLLFKECYAMEKIHGTSAHVGMSAEGNVFTFSGGASSAEFEKLFDIQALHYHFKKMFEGYQIVIYGEAYGGKQQGMKDTYGPDLQFVAFEVKIADQWLSVPQAAAIADTFELDFVEWLKLPTRLDILERYRTLESGQAIKNGMGSHLREGIVLRPILEVTKNNSQRIIAKWKNPEYSEHKKSKEVRLGRVELVANAQAVADDWVTTERLVHVLDAMLSDETPATIEMTGDVIRAMVADIRREGEGEIVWDNEMGKWIGKRTAHVFHQYLQGALFVDGEDMVVEIAPK